MTTQNKHRDRLRAAFDGGHWFLVRKDLFGIMELEEAVVLSFLCNIGGIEGGDWFRCSSLLVCQELHITPRVQERLMKKMYRSGWIQWRQRGQPAKRELYIDYEKIDRDLTQHISRLRDDDD